MIFGIYICIYLISLEFLLCVRDRKMSKYFVLLGLYFEEEDG